MRLPYVPNPPPTSSPGDEAIIQRIRARRAPRPLQPLDLTLLHSPPIADGWNSFLAAVRTQTLLSADLRELAICRVAVVNRAWYEWMHHAPLAEQAGVKNEALSKEGVVRREGELILVREDGTGTGEGGLNEKQWAVVCYTDEMTRNVQVREETFQRMRELFNEREIVEITATVGSCLGFLLLQRDDVCLLTDWP
jgi:alkylhydroperoxidase family enzyme